MNAWRFVTAWPRGFVGWIHTAVCALTQDEGRKAWAMLVALGCCVIMTAEVAFVLWVDTSPWHRFVIALSAQAVNFLVVTGLMVLLGVRRKTGVDIPLPGGGKISLAIDDSGVPVVVQTTPVAPPVVTPAPIPDPNPPPIAPPSVQSGS